MCYKLITYLLPEPSSIIHRLLKPRSHAWKYPLSRLESIATTNDSQGKCGDVAWHARPLNKQQHVGKDARSLEIWDEYTREG